MEDDAGILVVDRVYDRIVGAEHGRASSRDRDLIADFQRRLAVVHDDERRIGKDPDVGQLLQGVDDDSRIRHVAGYDVEAGRQSCSRRCDRNIV